MTRGNATASAFSVAGLRCPPGSAALRSGNAARSAAVGSGSATRVAGAAPGSSIATGAVLSVGGSRYAAGGTAVIGGAANAGHTANAATANRMPRNPGGWAFVIVSPRLALRAARAITVLLSQPALNQRRRCNPYTTNGAVAWLARTG